MSVQLEREDFRRLVAVVQDLPGFETERDRRRLLELALGGTPRAARLVKLIDLSGAPMFAASEVVKRLESFGELEDGKHALGVFLNAIIPYVDAATAGQIRGLFLRYPLDVPIAPQPAIDAWRAGPGEEDTQEKVVGENTFYHVALLRLALQASRAVVYLRFDSGGGGGHSGTGFMVADDLLMTNHHVIQPAEMAARTSFHFDYELARDHALSPVRMAAFKAGGAFHTSPELDYTLLQLDQVPDFGPPLTLSREPLVPGESVTIIGHPLGHYKQISLRNNAVHYSDARIIQYTSSTEPGSSGSPVLGNVRFGVVAIHHSGGWLKTPTTWRRHFRNEGTAAPALLDDLKARAPGLHALLER